MNGFATGDRVRIVGEDSVWIVAELVGTKLKLANNKGEFRMIDPRNAQGHQMSAGESPARANHATHTF